MGRLGSSFQISARTARSNSCRFMRGSDHHRHRATGPLLVRAINRGGRVAVQTAGTGISHHADHGHQRSGDIALPELAIDDRGGRLVGPQAIGKRLADHGRRYRLFIVQQSSRAQGVAAGGKVPRRHGSNHRNRTRQHQALEVRVRRVENRATRAVRGRERREDC